MAEYLMSMTSARRSVVATLLSGLAVCLPVVAEELVDPTQPPAGFGQSATVAPETSGPILQSIVVSPTRKIAIISGKMLKVGDKYGDARILSINDNEVVLLSGGNREVLKLYPSLRKAVTAKNTPVTSLILQDSRTKR
jgi:MSHA biogenesis protein MshK